MEISKHDLERIIAASSAAGEYLEELGKTDLANLSKDEWFNLLNVIIYNHEITAPF